MTDQNKSVCEGHLVVVAVSPLLPQCYIIVSYVFICIEKFVGFQTITPILTFIVFNFSTLLSLQWFYVTDRGINLVLVFL